MKLTYTEFAERFTRFTNPAVMTGSWMREDEMRALVRIFTDMMPLLRDIEASAAAVPTVELADEDVTVRQTWLELLGVDVELLPVIAIDPAGIRGDEPMTEETMATELGNFVRFTPSDEK